MSYTTPSAPTSPTYTTVNHATSYIFDDPLVIFNSTSVQFDGGLVSMTPATGAVSPTYSIPTGPVNP